MGVNLMVGIKGLRLTVHLFANYRRVGHVIQAGGPNIMVYTFTKKMMFLSGIFPKSKDHNHKKI